MSEGKYKEPITETDKVDVEILELISQEPTKSLEEELLAFKEDFKIKDCQAMLSITLFCLISAGNPSLNGNVRSNCVHFIGRISLLLKLLLQDGASIAQHPVIDAETKVADLKDYIAIYDGKEMTLLELRNIIPDAKYILENMQKWQLSVPKKVINLIDDDAIKEIVTILNVTPTVAKGYVNENTINGPLTTTAIVCFFSCFFDLGLEDVLAYNFLDPYTDPTQQEKPGS